MTSSTRPVVLVLVLALASAGRHAHAAAGRPADTDAPPVEAGPPSAGERRVEELLAELVGIDTSRDGSTTPAAEAMARRLRAAGLPAADVEILGPSPRRKNLVARLRGRAGSGLRPILLMAHLDVVVARAEDWTVPTYKLTRRAGWLYGRGTTDDKHMAAAFVAILLDLLEAKVVPERDVILALTADEEGGDENGVSWLLAHHRAKLDAALAINEGGDGARRGGKPLVNELQASEKVYQTFLVEAAHPGGHSSLPTPVTAITRLVRALDRIGRHQFPLAFSPVARGLLGELARTERGALAARLRKAARGDRVAATRLGADDPYFNAMLRTTCVTTRLDAGHADNALPQRARATVNCRILPGERPDGVRDVLARVIADPDVTITAKEPATPSAPSPLDPAIVSAVERATAAVWPGIPVMPTMSTGATDGLHTRNAGIPTYGTSGMMGDIEDVRAHGQDERIDERALRDGYRYLGLLVRDLAGVRARARAPAPPSAR